MSPDNSKHEFFEKELLKHIDALHNFAFYLTHNEEEADDLVQETYYKAFKHLDYFEDGTNSKAWLFKILKNNFINEYRRKSRSLKRVDFEEVLREFDDEDEIDLPDEVALDPDVAGLILGDEITEALKSIPLDYRSLIVLSDLEDFTYEEIAKILDIPLGTVRSRLHRARAMLKKKLHVYAKGLGINEKHNKD